MENLSKKLLTLFRRYYIMGLALRDGVQAYHINNYLIYFDGVWLSLARVPDLGSGGRRFESCHPDLKALICINYAGVVQW